MLINAITGNASLIVSLLGLGSEKHRSGTTLESEILRRRFWAYYLMNCHAAEAGTADRPSERTLKFPLPWPEEDFVAGITNDTTTTLESGFSNGSLYAELSRSLTLWYIGQFIKQSHANGY